MVYIPVELTESLKKGECVLFVGAGLSKGFPQWKELVEPLADELGVSMDKDPRIIASWYENEFGRSKLEEKIVSQLNRDVPLPKTHTILANLPLKAIVTTNYDNLLEKALSEKKRNVTKIVYDKQAPLAEANQLQIIKMHGDIDDPSTIVITKKDYDEYPEKHKALITHLLGLLISSHFLFVGFSLEDPNFDNIHTQIKSLFGESKRKSFAIFKNPPSFETKRLKEEMGIEVIPIEEYDEISEIFERLISICRRPRIKTELTSWELENIQDTFCEVVERQNKWLDPRGIFQFDTMLTKRDVELEDVYVVPRLVKQETIRKRKKKKQERDEGEGKVEKSLMYSAIGKEPKKGIEPTRKEEEMEEYIFEKEVELTIKDAISNVKNNHMVILGNPGIGKTCLLRYIALKASTNAGESLGIGKRLLPVLIPLKEYPQFGHDQMFKEFVFHYIKNRICSLSEEVLEYFLERNSFFFLLDGLDEVVSESDRIQISRQVEQFMAQYPRTRMILTSRPAGYRTAALIGAIPHFTLAEFNDDEIREFLVKWFTFLEKVEEEFEEGKAEEKANNLLHVMVTRERILRLARNPLLLTILVLIHRVGRKLPERRAEFYEYAVRTVAGTWETWKSLHIDRKIPDQGKILAVLEKIGFLLHNEKQENVVQAEELRIWLKDAMEEELGSSSEAEIDDFIWMLSERAGLLTERGLGLYGFVHLTFQEHFAARYIALGRGTYLAQNLIKKKLYSSRWKEVFLLAAGIAPPQQADLIFDSILQAENDFEKYIHSNLIFAGEALGDQPRISDSKRKDIINRLESLTGSDNVNLLRIEALEVLMKVRKVFHFEDSWGFELLRDEHWNVREQAVRYFATIGAEDAEIKERIFELLRDDDRDVREQAVRYFATIGAEDAKIKEKFFEMLRDEDWRVREQAVRYFATIGAEDAEIKERIFELLRDEDWNVREQAVRYFATIGAEDAEIKERIFELLRDEHWNVREQAVRYFATIGAEDAEIKEKFFELLRDESYTLFSGKRVQDVAAEYLSKHAREESSKKAPILFTSKDELTKRGAYKLMKALLTDEDSRVQGKRDSQL